VRLVERLPWDGAAVLALSISGAEQLARGQRIGIGGEPGGMLRADARRIGARKAFGLHDPGGVYDAVADDAVLSDSGVGTKKPDGEVDQAVFARGQGWHTDGPWEVRGVAKATQLYGLELPSVGGDTWFANMYEAYEALPEAMKRRLEAIEAEYVYGGRDKLGVDLLAPDDRDAPPVRWPVIRTHPETGRKSLYFNPHHFLRFVGMDGAEGDALFEELKGLMIRPDAEYHHKWRVHDYVVWDNRCSNHAAAGGYPIHERRVHWRATMLE
jgi:taurine dioxygenase